MGSRLRSGDRLQGLTLGWSHRQRCGRLVHTRVYPNQKAICKALHYQGVAEIDAIGRRDYLAADRRIAAVFDVPEHHVESAVEAIDLVYTQDQFVAVDGAAKQLRRLHEAGLRLGIVSNADGRIEAELARHRICSRDGTECVTVEVVIDSHVVGLEKPDPAIFSLALDELGLPTERCVYLGDSAYFDVQGARAAGIAAVHVTPYGECGADDHPHVQSLDDFVDGLVEHQRQ